RALHCFPTRRSSDLEGGLALFLRFFLRRQELGPVQQPRAVITGQLLLVLLQVLDRLLAPRRFVRDTVTDLLETLQAARPREAGEDRKSTRLNSSHVK